MPRTSPFSLDVLGSLLDPGERARVDGYALRDDGGGVDAFGVSRRALARGFAAGRFVHQSLISVRAEGLEGVPAQGPAILAVASQRPSALDLLAAVVEVFGAAPTPRLVRTLGDERWSTIPYVGTALRGLGQVPHNMSNAESVLSAGHLLGVSVLDHEALSYDLDGPPMLPSRQGHVFVASCLDWARRLGVPVLPAGIAWSAPRSAVVDEAVAGGRVERLVRRGLRRATGVTPGSTLHLQLGTPRAYDELVERGRRKASLPEGVAAAEGLRRALRRALAEAASEENAEGEPAVSEEDVTHG